MFSIEFKAGKEDYSKVFWAYYLSIRRKWVTQLITVLILLASVFVFRLAGYFTSGLGKYLPFFFISTILIYFSHIFTDPGKIGNKAVSDENLYNQFSCIVDHESFMIKNQFNEIKLGWENFHKIIESPDLFLLFFAKNQFQFIPKNAFQSEIEIQTFKNLLASKVSNIKELPQNLNYHPDFKKLYRMGIFISVLGWFSLMLALLFYNFSS